MPVAVKTTAEMCVGLVWTLVWAIGGWAADEGINIPAFKVLCDLGRQMEAIAQMDPSGVVSKLTKWGTSEELIAKIEKFKSEANSSSGGVVEIKIGDNFVVKFHSGRCTAKANVFLSAITQRLKNKDAEVKRRKRDAEEALGSAKRLAPGAFGDGANEGKLKEAGNAVAKGLATTHNRNAACKEPDGSRKAGKAGSSIPHDILCVCAQHTSQTQTCGVTVSQTWQSTFSSGENDWDLLADQCGKPESDAEISVRLLEQTLSNFHNELGRGKVDSSQTNPKLGIWTLGQIKATGACDGKSNGICVNYAKTGGCRQDRGGCERGEIGWLKVLENVLGRLREAEAAEAEANQTIRDAEALFLKAQGMLMDLNASAATGDCEPGTNELGRGGATRGTGGLSENAAATATGKQAESVTLSAQKAAQTISTSTFLICLLGTVSL